MEDTHLTKSHSWMGSGTNNRAKLFEDFCGTYLWYKSYPRDPNSQMPVKFADFRAQCRYYAYIHLYITPVSIPFPIFMFHLILHYWQYTWKSTVLYLDP